MVWGPALLAALFTVAPMPLGSPGERAAIASRNIQPREVVLDVPWSQVVTSEMGELTDLGRAASGMEDTSEHDLLACWLLTAASRIECGDFATEEEKSLTSRYMASLHTLCELAHLPIFWQKKDQDRLAGSTVGAELEARLNEEQDYYERLLVQYSGLSEEEGKERQRSSAADAWFTVEEWRWARAIVTTRGFTVPPHLESEAERLSDTHAYVGEEPPSDPEEDVLILCPDADMLNHQYNECEANCEWGVCKKTGSFVVRSRWGARDIKKGTELTMSYGSLGASSALLNYGFVPIINPEGFADTDTFKFKTASISVQLPIILGVMAASAAAAESESVETVVETDVASSGAREPLLHRKSEIWMRDEGVYSSDWRLGERRIVLGVGTRGAAMTLLSLCRFGVASSHAELDRMHADLAEEGWYPDGREGASDREEPFGAEEGDAKFEDIDMHEAEGEVEVDEEEDDFPIVAAVLARRPQNWENEKVALRAMTKLIQHQLAVYRTSLSEDLDFLESRKGESEMDAAMNAARIMSFEKQTLMHWSRIAEKAVQHLDEAKGFAAVGGLDYDAALTSLMDSDVRFE